MSRTYRRSEEWYWDANSRYYDDEEFDEYQKKEREDLGIKGYFHLPSWGWAHKCRITKKGRDRKGYQKPTKDFKSMYRRIERSKVKHAMRNSNFENIPRFRKTDVWNWT